MRKSTMALLGVICLLLGLIWLDPLQSQIIGGGSGVIGGGSGSGTGMTADQTAQLARAVSWEFDIRAYGAVADGTDCTDALNAAIVAAQAAGGGSVFIPPGTWQVDGAVVLPRTGPSSHPMQKPVRIHGSTNDWKGGLFGVAVNGGSTLDLRYAGTGAQLAKIDTRGEGSLEIDHLNLIDGAGTATPFVFCTNTTLHFHHCNLFGNTAQSHATCTQDAIIFGGQGLISTAGLIASDGDTAPFQGYGSHVHDNFYNNLRRIITFGNCSNSIRVDHEVVADSCGSSGTHDAPYYFDPGAGTYETDTMAAGCVLSDILVENSDYAHLVSMIQNCKWNYFSRIDCWQSIGTSLYYVAGGSTNNIIISGYASVSTDVLTGTNAASQSVIGLGATKNVSQFPKLALGTGATTPVATFQVGLPTGAGTDYSTQNLLFGANATDYTGNLSIYTNSTATVGHGGSITLGGETGHTQTPYPFACIRGVKATAGASYNGDLVFSTDTAGTMTEKLRISSAGKLTLNASTISGAANVDNIGQTANIYGASAASAAGILGVFASDAVGDNKGGSIVLGGDTGLGTTSTPYPFVRIGGVRNGAGNGYGGKLVESIMDPDLGGFTANRVMTTTTDTLCLSQVGGGMRRTSVYVASTTLSGASTAVTLGIPANVRILGMEAKVTTAIESGDGATSFTITYTGGSTAVAMSGGAFTLSTKLSRLHPTYELTTNTTQAAITPNSGTFSAGVVRIVVYYESIVDLT